MIRLLSSFQDSVLSVIPFLVGSHLPSFSKYSRMLILTDPLNLLTESRLLFVKDQNSSPSSFTCLSGLDYTYSSSDSDASLMPFRIFFYWRLYFLDINNQQL